MNDKDIELKAACTALKVALNNQEAISRYLNREKKYAEIWQEYSKRTSLRHRSLVR